MKKITWMEIAIAMPMVLTFASFGGTATVAGVSSLMIILMALLRWGRKPEAAPVVVPVPVGSVVGNR